MSVQLNRDPSAVILAALLQWVLNDEENYLTGDVWAQFLFYFKRQQGADIVEFYEFCARRVDLTFASYTLRKHMDNISKTFGILPLYKSELARFVLQPTANSIGFTNKHTLTTAIKRQRESLFDDDDDDDDDDEPITVQEHRSTGLRPLRVP